MSNEKEMIKSKWDELKKVKSEKNIRSFNDFEKYNDFLRIFQVINPKNDLIFSPKDKYSNDKLYSIFNRLNKIKIQQEQLKQIDDNHHEHTNLLKISKKIFSWIDPKKKLNEQLYSILSVDEYEKHFCVLKTKFEPLEDYDDEFLSLYCLFVYNPRIEQLTKQIYMLLAITSNSRSKDEKISKYLKNENVKYSCVHL